MTNVLVLQIYNMLGMIVDHCSCKCCRGWSYVVSGAQIEDCYQRKHFHIIFSWFTGSKVRCYGSFLINNRDSHVDERSIVSSHVYNMDHYYIMIHSKHFLSISLSGLRSPCPLRWLQWWPSSFEQSSRYHTQYADSCDKLVAWLSYLRGKQCGWIRMEIKNFVIAR